MLSLAQMLSRCVTSSAASTRRRSKRWQRDSTVIGTLRISVVANTNLTCGGGQFVIERTGEDAGGRGLPDAAHAGQDPGLRNAPALERVRDGAHHRVLADQVGEGRGTVFARKHAVSGRRAAKVQSGARGVVHAAVVILRCPAQPGLEGWPPDALRGSLR